MHSKKAGGIRKKENGKNPLKQRTTDLVDDRKNCTKRTHAPETFIHNDQPQKKVSRGQRSANKSIKNNDYIYMYILYLYSFSQATYTYLAIEAWNNLGFNVLLRTL